MAKILVTGAGGYIGSVAVYLLLQNDYEVVALDNFSTGFKQPLELLQQKFPNKLKTYQKDTQNDLAKVFDENPDTLAIIHYAASLCVNESMKEPQKYFSNNVCGTQSLLSSALKCNIKNIIFSSTCATYGDVQKIRIEETEATNPTNVYGASKRMAEQILQWYGKLNGLKFVILRYFNVCGASDDGLIGDAKKPSIHLMQNAVRGALGLEEFFLTYASVNTPDKSPIRDYVNVVDLAQAHLSALNYLLEDGKNEIINIGTGSGKSVL